MDSFFYKYTLYYLYKWMRLIVIRCVFVAGSDAARGVQTMMDRLQDEQNILDELENAIASQNLQVCISG